MLRWIAILACMLGLPGAAQALSISGLSVQENVVGGATLDVDLTPGRTILLEAVLPAGSLFSAAQAVVDFEVEGAGAVAFIGGAQISGRDTLGCPAFSAQGGCDPLQSATLALFRTSPDSGTLFTMEPVCCGITGDVSTGVTGLASGSFRFVLDVSQLQGMSQPAGADTRLVAFVQVVPEPSSALVFAVGLVVIRARLGRRRSSG